jgi:hypothetical protein
MNSVRKEDWNNPSTEIRSILDYQSDDLFISCISYEPRTTGVLEILDKNYRARTGMFIVNDRSKSVHQNISLLKSLIKNKHIFDDISIKEYSIDNPIGIIIKIDEIIKAKFPEKQTVNITLDMTTIPRVQLLSVLYYLRHHPKLNILRILYISPQKYGKWLARGHRYSTIPSFFEGPLIFEKKTALVILTGFESERAISLIDDVEPAKLILVMLMQEASKEFKRLSSKVINQIDVRRNIDKEILTISANDPFYCKNIIIDLINKHSKLYDFFVAPMGTKLEVLGTYLAYEENPNFRIIYPRAFVYNTEGYSEGCKDIYEIILKK